MIKDTTQILQLPILVEQDEDNIYIVSCPVFRGGHSYGKTIDEAIAIIQEVIERRIEEENEKFSILHQLKSCSTSTGELWQKIEKSLNR